MYTSKVWQIAVVGLIVAAPAFAFTIDGNLSDWGVVVADNNGSTFNFLPNIGLLGSMVEDQNDTWGDGSFIGPAYGGQNFDGEMMAVAFDSGRIYIAIVTGQRPDNGFSRFAPGDLRIEASGITYGLEIGGGTGGQAGTAITEGATGTTYTLDSHGYTKTASNAAAAQTVGSIWSNVTWINSTIRPYPTQFAINASSSHFGDADYVYTRDSVTTQHSIIELSLDASILGYGNTASFHWRPSCDNDELDVFATIPAPEPTTVLFLLAGCFMFRKR